MTQPRPIQFAVSDEKAKALWQSCDGLEAFLRAMRDRGAWQVESIRAVCELTGFSLAQAKDAVHYSQTWADLRISSEKLHAELYKTAMKAGLVDTTSDEENWDASIVGSAKSVTNR